MDIPAVRKGQGSVKLTREEFVRRVSERFYDPSFDDVRSEIGRVIDVAWNSYDGYRKNPRTREAGAGFAHPEVKLPVEWLEARDRIQAAARTHDDPATRSQILVVSGAARHDQTCPGGMFAVRSQLTVNGSGRAIP